ncbi:MAG: HupE/UreJ family protein [Gemmatimonadota bacterium]|nr:HupE/UreJ family protein [Gemmatimonadota bacterium]
MNGPRLKVLVLFAVLAALTPPVAAAAAAPAADARVVPVAPHDIPADVIVRAFVKAEDGALWLVIRVPLTSMRDVNFPVRGPGYVEIEEASELIADQAKIWIADYVALFEESTRLPTPTVVAARISLPSDPSFVAYDRALAHIRAPPLAPSTDLILEQAMLDVILRTPVTSHEARFSIDPAWAHLGIRTTTVLRFITPAGAERVFQYTGNPGRVRLDPRWHQAFLRFVALGFAHILDGIDHLLFLLCLVIPIRRFWPLVSVVTAFTAAHSITLGASVLGLAPNALWFPPLIEMLIAASIVFMALENIVGKTLRRRWVWAFGFGLVHGFGFSFLLRESLQFAGSHLYTSLLAFNVGVEFGQLFALLFMVPGLALLFKKVMKPRIGAILLSALVAHTAWHWMTDRWGVLTAYNFQAPTYDTAFWALLLRWVLLGLIVGAAVWGLSALYRQLSGRLGDLTEEAEASPEDGGLQSEPPPE